ncbi:MAG TPA: hypothetical protein VFI73_11670 [Candidatus Nitrosopolaris sp.]|nr:hypothetical protein [Candidatus Nitrosopolaris sp.]
MTIIITIVRPKGSDYYHGKHSRNSNIAFAISYIIVLLTSSTLAGSSMGKVSAIESFGQQHQQGIPLRLWTVDSVPTEKQHRALPAIAASRISVHDNNIAIDKPTTFKINHFSDKRSISSSNNCTCPKPSNSTKPANVTTIRIVQNFSNIKGPVKVNFVNSYWTFNTAQDQFVAGTTSARTQGQSILPVIKQEVGPGEGPSILAVVLINEGFSAITGITSSLQLPSGFAPLITPQSSSIPGSDSQTALSSYDGTVEPGRTFTLYFGVKVLGNAQVEKQYNPELKLGYVKITELRQKHFRSETITVPFTISGRVILDAVSASPSLLSLSNVSSLTNSSSLIQTINVIPGIPNAVKLTIRNDGSAIARGVIVNIAGLTAASVGSTTVTVATNVSSGVAAQPSSSSTVILGSKVFSIGTISPSGSRMITLIIYPSIAAAGTVQTLNLGLSYDDAYGNRKTTSQLVGLQILPISPQSGLSVSPSPSSRSSTSPSSFSVSPATSSRNEMLTRVASFVHSPSNGISTNANNNTNPNVDPSNLTSTNQSPSSSSTYNSTTSPIQIAAGKIQNVTFTINNDNAVSPITSPLQNSITDLAVSLVSQSSLVRILGPSNWNLPTISPGTGQQLTTQVFAPTSLMGNPVVFTVVIQYIQNSHQVKTTSFNLGAMVVGDIQLRVSNLSVRYNGNTPTLVGKILNEGNSAALYASVDMAQMTQGQSQTETPVSLSSTSNNNFGTILTPSSSQYLGNIATNLAMPFNVPLQAIHVPISKDQQQNKLTSINNVNEKSLSLNRIAMNSADTQAYGMGTTNSTTTGIYPVLLMITYSDNLKNMHKIFVNSPVQIKPEQPEGSSIQVLKLFRFVIVAAAIGIVLLFIRIWLKSSRNENRISKTYKQIFTRTTVDDREAVIHTAHLRDEKNAGAPFHRYSILERSK